MNKTNGISYMGFDLDGTLIDSRNAIYNCLKTTLPKYSNSIVENVLDTIFPLTLDQFPKYIDFFSKKDFENFKHDFMKSFDETYFKNINMLSGARKSLELSVYEYKKNNVFILTNRRIDSAIQICQHLVFFDIILKENLFSSDKNNKNNPKIHSLKNIIFKKYKNNSSGCYLGDSILDIEAAYKNSILPVYIHGEPNKCIMRDFNLILGYNVFSNLDEFNKSFFSG